VLPPTPIDEMQARARQRVAQLPAALRALEPGPPYPVRISAARDALARSALRRAAT
jgi:nicotinate phosphoribosyltransferase